MDHALTRWSKGSVRDRLCLPDCLRASGPGSYIVPLRWRGGRQRRHFNAAKGGIYAHRFEGAIPQPSAQRAVKPKNPPADRPVKPGNLLHNPFAQPAADRRPQPAAQPRTLFNLRRSRHHHPQPPEAAVKLENLPADRPVHLKNPFYIYPSFFSQGNEEKKDHFITYFFLEGEKKKDDSLRNDGGPGPSGQ